MLQEKKKKFEMYMGLHIAVHKDTVTGKFKCFDWSFILQSL